MLAELQRRLIIRGKCGMAAVDSWVGSIAPVKEKQKRATRTDKQASGWYMQAQTASKIDTW